MKILELYNYQLYSAEPLKNSVTAVHGSTLSGKIKLLQYCFSIREDF